MNMATFKRLADKDVAAIFDSLHFGKEPPAHLDFHIVPVGPTGLKLSPPSYEFEGTLVCVKSHAAFATNVTSHTVAVVCHRRSLCSFEARKEERSQAKSS